LRRDSILVYWLMPLGIYVANRASHYHEDLWQFVSYHFIDLLTIYLAFAGITYARH